MLTSPYIRMELATLTTPAGHPPYARLKVIASGISRVLLAPGAACPVRSDPFWPDYWAAGDEEEQASVGWRISPWSPEIRALEST